MFKTIVIDALALAAPVVTIVFFAALAAMALAGAAGFADGVNKF